MKNKSNFVLFVLALSSFGRLANANEVFVSECRGQMQKNNSPKTYFTIKVPTGKLDLGHSVIFEDGDGNKGLYVITNIYAASFLDRFFELGYRGGFSHGEIRLTHDSLHNGPLRMQKFEGSETLEATLECK